jgi:DNA-binding CsgD family transcriptional regulator
VASVRLSPREEEILTLIAQDLSDKQIASQLGISMNTLRTHLSRVFRRQGVHSRAAAVAQWLLAALSAGGHVDRRSDSDR